MDTHTLLDNVELYLQDRIHRLGDEVIGEDVVRYAQSSLRKGKWVFLVAKDANDHNLTYGVLLSAVRALRNYMIG